MENNLLIDPIGVLSGKASEPLFRMSGCISAIASLSGQYIWFSRPDAWTDPYEQFFYNATYDGAPFGLKNRCFVACFSPVRTAEAQWLVYSHGTGESLRFDYDTDCLAAVLITYCAAHHCRAYIKQVQYRTTKEINSINPRTVCPSPYTAWREADWVKLLTFKRNAYLYENEIRIILVFDEEQPESQCGIKLDYACANTDLIHTIQLSPMLKDTNLITNILEMRFGFTPKIDSVGRKQPRVTCSRLYSPIKLKNYK